MSNSEGGEARWVSECLPAFLRVRRDSEDFANLCRRKLARQSSKNALARYNVTASSW